MRLYPVLAALVALSAQSAHAGRVAVVVELFEEENWGSSLDHMAGLREWQLDGLSPGTTVISVQARSIEELRERLAWAVVPGDTVEALVVDSHGGSAKYGPSYASWISSGPLNRVDVNLLQEAEVRAAFGPVVGRFSPGARVVFSGCNLVIPSEDRGEIRRAMGTTARALGLTRGVLYLNSTYGADAVGQAFLESPLDKPNRGAVFLSAFFQLTAPLSFPIAAIEDFVFNRGYALEVDRTRAYEVLRPARFHEVMEGSPAVSGRAERGGDPATAQWALAHPAVARGAI